MTSLVNEQLRAWTAKAGRLMEAADMSGELSIEA